MMNKICEECGGIYKLLPFTYICFLIGSFSLCGFPFLSGFYSKDILIEFSNFSLYLDNYFINYFSSFNHTVKDVNLAPSGI